MFIEPSAAERAKAGVLLAMPTRTRGRGRAGAAMGVLVLLAVTAVVVWAGWTRSATSAGGAAPANTTTAPAVVQEYTGTVFPIDPYAGPPADPFTGTPADHWADGAAGIVAPAARPVGDFTAKQVAAAYATARRLLIAVGLDRQTLLGGPPSALAGLLTPGQRAQFLGGLNKTGLDKSGHPISTRTWVVSFAPGTTQLIGNVIKVNGVMSARTAAKAGTEALVIEVNYLFDYAIEPPRNPMGWMHVVGHEYGTIDFARWDDPAEGLEPWYQASITEAGGQCGIADGYIHPDFPSDRSIDSRPSGPVINRYSLAPPPRTVCGRTTGT